MSEIGVRAAEILAERAIATIRPGLTDEEFRQLESRYHLRFGDDHRAFLAAGLPTGSGWPDWRSPEEMAIRLQIGRVARELHRAGADPALISKSSGVVPVYGVAFLEQRTERSGPQVWAVDGAEVTLAGHDLEEFIRWLCGGPRPVADPDRLAGSRFAPEPPVLYPPLNAPPFQPDSIRAVPQTVAPPSDPVAALAALGVALGPATRHDAALADGGAVSSVAVQPGRPAVELWEAVRARFPQTGLWPLLVTDATWHRVGPDESPMLAELDSQAWLEEQYERLADEGGPPRDSIALQDCDSDWLDDWVGFRPESYDRLALVPAWADWLVPGLVGWTGAVNYDVGGAEHATMLRRWSGHWGTELVALDDEFMTLRVLRPPPVEAARTCALEAYLYCPDAVEQGFNSVDELGLQMVRSLWSLWWD